MTYNYINYTVWFQLFYGGVMRVNGLCSRAARKIVIKLRSRFTHTRDLISTHIDSEAFYIASCTTNKCTYFPPGFFEAPPNAALLLPPPSTYGKASLQHVIQWRKPACSWAFGKSEWELKRRKVCGKEGWMDSDDIFCVFEKYKSNVQKTLLLMSVVLEELSEFIGYLFTNVATDEDKINLLWKAFKMAIIKESWHQ